MVNNKQTIEAALHKLVGLPLSIARQAADTRLFHFGPIRPHPGGRGTVGSCAIHIQCCWRLVGPQGIVTGYSDAFAGTASNADPDPDDFRAGDLQRIRIERFMGDYDEATRSPVDPAGRRVVTAVVADDYGSVEIAFNDGTRLQIFPDGSSRENWRFLPMDYDGQPHLVIAGGQVEAPETG